MRLSLPVAVGLILAACHPAPPKEYDYPAWGFSAEFQAPPKTTDQPGGVKHHAVLVEADTGFYDFAVYAIDAPERARSIDEFTDLAAPIFAKTIGVEVGPKTYVATVQLPEPVMGREVQFTKSGRPYAAMRVYQVGGRYYEVAARSQLGPTDPAAVAFLDSFKILGAAAAGATKAG